MLQTQRSSSVLVAPSPTACRAVAHYAGRVDPAQKSSKENGNNDAARTTRNGTIIAASITAVAGLIGVMITVFGNHSPAPPPAPKPTSLAPTSAPASSPQPTQSSQTQDTETTTADPLAFNNGATDPTRIGIATLLPQQYDAAGVAFQRETAAEPSCPNGDEETDVANILSNNGCTTEVVGSYLDSEKRILVSVWVVPMPDAADASNAYNAALQSSGERGWGAWCPATGVGSQICHEPWNNAAYAGWTGHCHRYLTRALALYVDLRSGSSAQAALDSAASAANSAIGANNIPAAQC